MKLGKKYRAGVVGVFKNAKGELLICERTDRKGAWQFPQGGIDGNETPEEALRREMLEELGSTQFEILYVSPDWTCYDFPQDMATTIAQNYLGQRHLWFLLQFAPGAAPDLAKSEGEFCAYKWTSPKQACEQIVGWKQAVYIHGLQLLKLI